MDAYVFKSIARNTKPVVTLCNTPGTEYCVLDLLSVWLKASSNFTVVK